MLLSLILGMALVDAPLEPLVDEIVVTARQPNTPIEDSPASIEAFGSEELAKPGEFMASDLSRLSPGLTYKSTFGSSAPQFFIRGIGSNDVNPSANPGVAVYLNDVLLASPLGQNLATFDLSGAQILKGPQGTLFGRNATGGAIVFRTNRPGDAASATAAVGVGSFGLRTLEAAADTGTFNGARARFAGFARRSDGYTKNTATGGSLNGLEVYGGRATVLVDGPGGWTGEVLADYAVDRSSMTAHEGLGLFAPEGLAGNPPRFVPCAVARASAGACVNALGYKYTTNPYSEAFDRPGREDLDAGGVSVTIAHSGQINIQSITAYRTAKRAVREDSDASPLSLVALDFDNDDQSFTQEVLVRGSGSRLDWRAGVFALDEQLKTRNRFEVLGTVRAAGAPFIDDPQFFVFGPFRLLQSYRLKTQSVAAFADADWAASPALTLTAGVRLTQERSEFTTETRFDEVTANPILSPRRGGERSDTATSWRLAARYALGSKRSIYANVSRGFKSAGFNGGALFATDSIGPVAPEVVTAYEVGAKWQATDRVELETAGYVYDYTSLQVFTLRAAPPPTRQVLDSANASISGLDLRAKARLPAGVTATASVAYLDAAFTDFIDANGVSRSGNRLTAAPEFSGIAALAWRGKITSQWTAAAEIRAKYRSRVFFDNTNDPLLSSGASTLVDVSVSLEHPPSGLQADISVRNLTDESVIADALNLGQYGFIQRTYAPPRAVYLTVRKRL
ncbi:TonB-dependent receptor [Phenylobacterium sp.]|jgi:iron complex outermembrane receptor protein|uniref:TonB-dependent receptor n=1 Tax=Phenylobacterium sp. TaxID=1871053 RepID=UPI0037C6966F